MGGLVLVGHGLAARRAVLTRRDWWMTAKWASIADVLRVMGLTLMFGSVVILGMAALQP